MKRPTLLALLVVLTVPAGAHPFAKDTWSLASALKLSERGLQAVVVLEVPVPVVLADIQGRIDAGASKRKALKDHDDQRFADLGGGLTLTVNGVAQPVEWRPIEHPTNGKAAEGFFLYWVGAQLPPDPAWGDAVTVKLDNAAYADVKMVYTGSAEARDGWAIGQNTAVDVIGFDITTLEKTDTRAWTANDALRHLKVAWKR